MLSTFIFYLESMALGVGLSMDACAVSMANGLNEPQMKKHKLFLIAFMFGLFQGVMPLLGYLLGNVFLQYIEKFIPWIALGILSFLGIKMIIEGTKKNKEEKVKKLTFQTILIQAIATSIDALGVGITFADYKILEAVVAVLIIGVITFSICVIAVLLGKRFGDKLGNKAIILGGIILVAIGLEIFITGII